MTEDEVMKKYPIIVVVSKQEMDDDDNVINNEPMEIFRSESMEKAKKQVEEWIEESGYDANEIKAVYEDQSDIGLEPDPTVSPIAREDVKIILAIKISNDDEDDDIYAILLALKHIYIVGKIKRTSSMVGKAASLKLIANDKVEEGKIKIMTNVTNQIGKEDGYTTVEVDPASIKPGRFPFDTIWDALPYDKVHG